VTGNIALRLDNVALNDVLLFIIKEYNLAWERTGDIIKIYKPTPPPLEIEPLDIIYENELLSVDLENADLERLVDTLIEITGHNIILDGGVRGRITGKLIEMEFEKALKVLLPANGFSFRMVDQVIYIGQAAGDDAGGTRARNLYVACEDGLVTLEASNIQLADVVSMISSECSISILVQTQLEGTTTAQFEQKSVDEAMTYLLMNSAYTFRETGGVFFIGDRNSQDLFDTKLISITNLVASSVEPLIPVSLSQSLTIKVVKEHNGLLVTGPRTLIARLEDFVSEVDIPAAQVLFEVLVIDYSTTERAEFGLTANNFGGDSGLPGQIYWPNWDYSGTGKDANDALRSIERRLDLPNLGVLDDEFFIRLQMLEREGKANVQSRPQIATLNGHSASISIGTTQYYLLESQTIYPSQQTNVSTQTSQRFETIKADMSLIVTPYVSRNGDVIVEVAPEFSTPAGQLDPDIPPTINSRVLNSTVRLKDGETIVLGGLIQETESVTIDKVPILGSIPIIGRLFQNRTSDNNRSELMIYITPHVHFGSEGSVNLDSLIIKK
jgi:type IV pilus assembly protein PilQ